MYKPVPPDANKIYLEMWSCGSECCGAAHFNIWCHRQNNPYRQSLWSSETIYYEDYIKEEIQELQEEIIEAAKHYGLELIDIDSDCIFDWKSK